MGREPSLQVIPWHLLTPKEIEQKTLSRVSRKSASWHYLMCAHGHPAVNQGKFPILITPIRDASQQLVITDVCQAAQITGSPNQLASRIISQLQI